MMTKLYRGDSLPNVVVSSSSGSRGRTFAGHFCGNGLMAKFADNGSTALLGRRDLLDLVLVHVGYDLGTPEEALAKRSPLVSFSTRTEIAFRFSERSQKKDLEFCTLDRATHFVWELDIDLSRPIEPGRYAIPYKSDSVNCRSIILERIERGRRIEAEIGDLSTIARSIMDLATTFSADSDECEHYAEVIDVEAFIKGKKICGRDQRLVKNTLERAARDHEWLLFPMDPMVDGPGYSAHFAMNRHLRVHGCFRERTK